MATTRITLLDGTRYDAATALAQRPAALHFVDNAGGARCVDLRLVRQIEMLVEDPPPDPGQPDPGPQYRGPLPGEITELPLEAAS